MIELTEKYQIHHTACMAMGACPDCDHDHTCNCDGPELRTQLMEMMDKLREQTAKIREHLNIT